MEVPEELIRITERFTILQNDSPLSQDDSNKACWLLNPASAQATVRWDHGDDSQEINLGQEDYLLYKLGGPDNQGRLIKSTSSGSYLVITPDTWDV